jgi:hypothetical protein
MHIQCLHISLNQAIYYLRRTHILQCAARSQTNFSARPVEFYGDAVVKRLGKWSVCVVDGDAVIHLRGNFFTLHKFKHFNTVIGFRSDRRFAESLLGFNWDSLTTNKTRSCSGYDGLW